MPSSADLMAFTCNCLQNEKYKLKYVLTKTTNVKTQLDFI